MLDSINPLINITGATGQALSKEQQKFNRLIGQIAQRRSQLMAWEAALPRCAAIYGQRVHPLDEQIDALHQRAPVVLSQSLGIKGLSRSLRKQLRAIILDMIARTPESSVTPELKEIYNQLGNRNYDDDKAEDEEFMKDMLSEITGIDLGDASQFDSPEDMLKQAARKFAEQHESGEGAASGRAGRRKSAKQIAKEEARAAEEKSATQSVREVYRKLASALHPDREADPAERQRKTDLMQRANDAYTRGNLLQLLELQWELEQIDPAALGRLPEQKLKHYLRVLKDQHDELGAELRDVEMRAIMQFQLPARTRIDPATLARILEQEVVRKEKLVRDMKEELELFKRPDALRAFVKAYQHQLAEDFDEIPF